MLYDLLSLKMTLLILEFCPLQVTTVKLCIIMKKIFIIAFSSCATFDCLSFNLVTNKQKKASKCQTKIFLIEFVEVPLEFNIIF